MANRKRSLFDFIYEANMISGTLRAVLFVAAFSVIGGTAAYLLKSM